MAKETFTREVEEERFSGKTEEQDIEGVKARFAAHKGDLLEFRTREVGAAREALLVAAGIQRVLDTEEAELSYEDKKLSSEEALLLAGQLRAFLSMFPSDYPYVKKVTRSANEICEAIGDYSRQARVAQLIIENNIAAVVSDDANMLVLRTKAVGTYVNEEEALQVAKAGGMTLLTRDEMHDMHTKSKLWVDKGLMRGSAHHLGASMRFSNGGSYPAIFALRIPLDYK